MKFEKVVLVLGLIIYVLAVSHTTVAESQSFEKEINLEASNLEKTTVVPKKKPGLPTTHFNQKVVRKRLVAVNFQDSQRPALAAQKSAMPVKQNHLTPPMWRGQPMYQSKLIEANRVAQNLAATRPIAPDDYSTTSTPTRIAMPTPPASPIPPSDFSGSVNMAIGSDSNATADKVGNKATFYQTDSTLTFAHGGWTATAGAMIRDFADQNISNEARQDEANGAVTYKGKISDYATSTTTISELYHDERWPNFISGPGPDGIDPGLPIRYMESKALEQVDFDFGALKTQIGGYGTYRDSSAVFTDFAPDILQERLENQSFYETSAFGKVGLAANDNLEFDLLPSIVDRQFLYRQGLQPDGTPGGTLLSAPVYHLLISQGEFDVNFKLLGSTITPMALIGQTSDESLGAMDNAFYAYGLKSNIVLDQSTKLTITPTVLYKQINFDNFTYEITNNQVRQDTITSFGVKASLMFNKNIGWNIAYAYEKYVSNWVSNTTVNYNEEIVSSALMLTF